MPYTINHFNGSVFTSLADGVIDRQFSSSINLVGKNVTGYGTAQNDNFLWLLENFAGTAPPINQIQGQLWYDNSLDTLKLKAYNGYSWDTLLTSITTATSPASTVAGLWYDTTKDQLFLGTGSGTNWSLLGPESIPGFKKTKFESSALLDTNNISHSAVRLFNDGKILGVITTSSFSVKSTQDVYTASIRTTIGGINLVPGIGVQTNYISAGATTSTGTLVGKWTADSLTAANTVTSVTLSISGNAVITSLSSNLVTATQIVSRYITAGSGLTTGTITGNWTVDALTTPSLTATNISASGVFTPNLTATNIISTNISASGVFTPNLTATNIISTLISTGGYASPGTITGDWGLSAGSKLTSTYADLAENYTADDTYSPGMVMEFGGSAETTLCQTDMSTRVAGIISTAPAFLLNDQYELEGYTYSLALSGRVPCYVKGTISKGDMLVSGEGGYARSESNPKPGTIIARAIDSYDSNEIGMIEVQVCRG